MYNCLEKKEIELQGLYLTLQSKKVGRFCVIEYKTSKYRVKIARLSYEHCSELVKLRIMNYKSVRVTI